ncbi:MAG: heptaprenyl diphosphate synthase synthase subunit 1 family protein [Bacillales bacterium]|jgi:heptaprenyl diphosphate synthase|nr:heptaprenyl diphosphate synthase synthase subunit 1 family protein [Bacillales bacterium]
MNEQQLVNEVIIMLEKKLFHPLLNEKLGKSFINAEKVQLFVKIFTQAGLEKEMIIEHSSAVMIMQIALDIHDLVTNDCDDEETLLNRQLIILAGDYYSGLYYQMIANAENKLLLDYLSEGIKEINEWKIIYQYEDSPLEVRNKALLQINTLLLTKSCKAYGLESQISEIESLYSK